LEEPLKDKRSKKQTAQLKTNLGESSKKSYGKNGWFSNDDDDDDDDDDDLLFYGTQIHNV
jgi:hypothetical protein